MVIRRKPRQWKVAKVSKTLIENTAEDTLVPFLRGIMVHSLQEAGLSFKQAHSIATDIRSQVGNKSQITTDDLEQRVIKKLGQLKEPGHLQRYKDRRLPRLIEVEHGDGQISEFSPELYRNELEAIGLKPGEAVKIVAAVSEHLAKRRVSLVKSNYISHFTYRMLRKSKSLGPAVAHRWLVWRDFINSGRPLVILLGGTPGSGKSTIAADIASRLNIVRTQSTDMLREVMRSIIPVNVQPLLHRSSFSAWTLLSNSNSKDEAYTEALLIEGFSKQAAILFSAIEAVIQRAVRESVSLIVEGVHLHPASTSAFKGLDDALVVPVMLAVPSSKGLRKRITGRSSLAPQRRSQHYLEHFESIWKLQAHLLDESDQAGVPIIINDSREHVFREVMLATIQTLSQEFDKTPEKVFG